MSVRFHPGTSGSGGGLLLRSPADQFQGVNRAAAEGARDAAITNVAAELEDFTENPNLAIILTITGTDPNTTVYQARRGNAWADVSAVVRGPQGVPGPVAANLAQDETDLVLRVGGAEEGRIDIRDLLDAAGVIYP